jgi:LacI family transcriptional regulator
MLDVAEKAGVSLKTVSRVANNEPGVSSDTITRVEAAMDELGFTRNLSAGSLRRGDGRSDSIGLILASVDNPFDGAMHRAAEAAAEARKFAVIAASTDESPDREKRLVTALISRRVDGLIITPSGGDQKYLLPEMELGTPVVMIDRPPVGIEADCVLGDHLEAARLGTEHLISFGHRRIAFLGDLAHIASVIARLEGFNAAMKAAGLAVDPDLVSVDNHSENTAFGSALRMISSANPPTAIFAAQNMVTYGVVRALYERNLHKRIALVSFDDFHLADLLDPKITVIAQDPYAIGRAACERVLERLDNPGQPPKTTIIPARLIRRGSGELPPDSELGGSRN